MPAREPAFSFDSFLDVVTNVVGIIVRLILVLGIAGWNLLVFLPRAAQVARP